MFMVDIAFKGISKGFWGILRDFRSLRVFNDFKGFKAMDFLGILHDLEEFEGL